MRYHILCQPVQGTAMRLPHHRSRVRYPSPTTSKGLETHCHQATSKPSCMIASGSASKQGSYHRCSAHLILSTVGRRDIRLRDALKTSSLTRAQRHSNRGDPWILLTGEKGVIGVDQCIEDVS